MADIVQIERARADEGQTLARLMQLYLHDFSEFAPARSPYGELSDDGLFAYGNLASYWTEARREPLLARVNGHLAGFVLVNDYSALGRPVEFAIAEFFVARKYRRRGIGTEIARQVIGARAGSWEIAVLAVNRPAMAFWRRALTSIHAGPIEVIEGDGKRWRGTVFRLSSKPE